MKDRIISLMKHMGMSQKVFAAEICISEGALSSIFSGRTKPTLNTVSNIHERFPEVNMDWLIDGKGEMLSSPVPVPRQAETGKVPSSAVPQAGIPFQTSFADQPASAQQMPLQSSFLQADTKKLDKPLRRIAEIRVFYDDGTFETFSAKQ